MAKPTRTMLIASALGLASLAFAGGFAASSASAGPAPDDPIVNVNAWNETPPAMPVQVVSADAGEKCSPWDVSDIAMEEVLREMQRRGWRQPRQGDAVASMVALGVEGIDAVDPNAPMPRRGRGRISTGGDGLSMIAVLSEEDAERIRTEQISVDQVLVEQPPTPPPS
jgi:hypothetical protein